VVSLGGDFDPDVRREVRCPDRNAEVEASCFEHPAFAELYARAVADVADRRLEPATRKAAARALAFLLRETLVDERVATDVLAALKGSLDQSRIVRTLLRALRDLLSDHERTTRWTRRVADRALREGHLPSFVSAMRILVEEPHFDGMVPALWRLSILRAVEVPQLSPCVVLYVRAYASRFPEHSWRWVRIARVRSTIACLRRRPTPADFADAE
jgi:hypothetical protein